MNDGAEVANKKQPYEAFRQVCDGDYLTATSSADGVICTNCLCQVHGKALERMGQLVNAG